MAFVPEEVLGQATPAETKDGAVYGALRFHLHAGTGFGDYPEGPWHELREADGRVEFLAEYDAPAPDGALGVSMVLARQGEDWDWAGAGECRPTAHHPTLGYSSSGSPSRSRRQ